MEKQSVCRICLIKDVRMHCLVNTDLQEIYELLTGNLLEARDKRPVHACYMCCARLHNCLRLRSACLHSEQLFTRLWDHDDFDFNPIQVLRKLDKVSIIHVSVGTVVLGDLQPKPERPPATDDQLNEDHVEDVVDNVGDQGMFTQMIKQEDIKSENLYSEDDDLDHSIQSIEAADNSCLENDPLKSNISESGRSISSVNLQKICNKTVKVVLKRLDLNSFVNVAVNMKLKPVDVEDTSQSSNLNNNDSEQLSEPNVYVQNKNTVNVSSDQHNKCDICGKCFTTKNNLAIHIRIHSNVKPYICDTCNRCFRRKFDVASHIRIHTREKPYNCGTYGKGFYQKVRLLRHIDTHSDEKSYNCGRYGKTYSGKEAVNKKLKQADVEDTSQSSNLNNDDSEQLSEQNKNTVNVSSDQHKCDICEKCFNTNSSLLYDIPTRYHHRTYTCDTCNRNFSKNYDVASHFRIHNGEKPYSCGICGIGFYQKVNLSRHIDTHTGEIQYNCERYGKTYSGKGAVNKRLKPDDVEDTSQSSNLNNNDSEQLSEPNVVQNKNTVNVSSDQHNKCDICGKCFTTKRNLSVHIRTHSSYKPYTCDTCNRSFRNKDYLAIHFRTHTGEKPYKCDTCGKGFLQKTHLMYHSYTHTGEKPHKCELCGKSFSQKSHLTYHILTHTGEKPFKCFTCKKEFNLKRQLLKHTCTHTGEKPYKCDTGGKRYSEKFILLRHVRRYHSTQVEDVLEKQKLEDVGITQSKIEHMFSDFGKLSSFYP